MNLKSDHQKLLNRILSKVGDLSFGRRVNVMLEYLDVGDGDLILDAGCGEGFYAMIFDQLYSCRVAAIENDKKMLDMARNWLAKSQKISFEQADVCQLNHAESTFDKVVCTEVLEHIDDDKKAVSELFRVLKPGGVLAVTVPNKNYPFVWDPLNKIREWLGLGHFNPKNPVLGGIWSYDHKRLYSPKELAELLSGAGFVIEDEKVLTHYGVPFSNLVLYLGKSFYSKLPVPEDVKNSIDKFNDKDFMSSVSSVNVAIKARKGTV